MKTLVLPDLGEGLQEAEIIAWLVAPGDRVVIDQPLVSVETDKAVVEIPSPRNGRIGKLHANPGDVVRVGAPLVDFEDLDETPDTGTVVGEISRAPKEEEAPVREFRPSAPQRARESSLRAAAPRTPRSTETTRKTVAYGAVKAAPAVRDMARRLGVALHSVPASGPEGSITRDDVENGAPHRHDEALHGPRRAMAANMVRAHAEVARTTVVDEADIDGWDASQDVTVRLVRAIAYAARSEPALNAWYDGRAARRVLHENVDLGIAVDTKGGLYVPVLRDAGSLDAAGIRGAVSAMRQAAEEHAFKPDDLHGATISLSNFGMIAGRFAQLMIVPPQVAIVGAGRIERRVVASENAPVVRRLVPLSLTFDHRAVFGAEAARFLRAMMVDLTKPS